LQEALVKGAQFLAQSLLTGKRVVDIEAIGSTWGQFQMEAQFDDEQGMLEQKATKLTGVDQSFADANQKGFEIGADRG
jgi:hypothetical protein